MVKSYNERRGFGFVACTETTEKYGRDVYIAKTEAQLVTAEGTKKSGLYDKHQVLTLAEEDFIRFHVRLSVEGFPQAERIQRMRKFQGVVLCAPPLEGEELADEEANIGRIVSDDFAGIFGHREVLVRRPACGHARLASGDRVSFCLKDVVDSTRTPGRDRSREAHLVVLAPNPQTRVGSVLGCFILNLPRAPLYEGWPARADLSLDCHALGDRIILSGLPPDVDQAELMRFFQKQGASGATVAHARGGSFASAAFPSMAEVARFVARNIHTFADDKETRIARLLARRHNEPDASRLPGLPAPVLLPSDEAGVLLVTWSPVVLATGYVVELRPAGVSAPWSAVDASDGHVGSDSGGRFDQECSSCKVSGLPSNIVFEARVTYFTSCGCRSDASDPSEWCVPCPTAASLAGGLSAQLAAQAGAAGFGSAHLKGCWPHGAAAPIQMQQLPELWSGAWQGVSAAINAGVGMAAPEYAQLCGGALSGYMQPLGWRCVHGSVNPPPSMPELRPADDAGFAILVQWPSVRHATAYVVELRETGSQRVERFIRSVPVQALGSLVELRIGGLRPGGSAGQCYVAQVRCVAACGCESEPSPAGVSQPLGVPAAPVQTPVALSLASTCAAPGCAASGAAGFGSPAPAAGNSYEQAKLGFQYQPHAPPPYSSSTPGERALPNLLSSRPPPVPPPAGPAPFSFIAEKQAPPEVTGNEDDCIILD